MAQATSAESVLNRHFLEMRCRVLELAASLDRIGRADGAEHLTEDDRLVKLRRAIESLIDGQPDRATRIQMLFSDTYEPDWPRPEKGRS
jgi:hypothetical protein